ncbi:hypothetical protein ACRCD7_08040 [Aliarcobacter sp. ERUVET-7]|uniref:Uncharacterized protein n=2 Tax=Arcobacteraceae TaxID=2808963 RepID=A0AAU0P761_9BACT|nr:hypothetical protein [Aliarcobacter cryaerophilus]MCT7508515.1 hypothetical protein [Aliarcobacter cryaerophilus]WNL16949.1 hypothetical protein RJG54_00725 [Arcobacter sp. AZ-2023]WPD04056.1 hypothetical protein QUR79_04030 [Arcobacter sp. DSM 115972]
MNATFSYGGYDDRMNQKSNLQVFSKETITSKEYINNFIVEGINLTTKVLSGILSDFHSIDYDKLRNRTKLDSKTSAEKIIEKLYEQHKNVIALSKTEYLKLLNKTFEDILISFAYRKYYEEDNTLERNIKFTSILDEGFFILEILENLGIPITLLISLEREFHKFLIDKLISNSIVGEWGKVYVDKNEIYFLIYQNERKITDSTQELKINNIKFDSLF